MKKNEGLFPENFRAKEDNNLVHQAIEEVLHQPVMLGCALLTYGWVGDLTGQACNKGSYTLLSGFFGPASSASSSWTYSVATPGYPAWSVSNTRPVWYRGQICEISR